MNITDNQLIEMVSQLGQREAARRLGIARSTLQDRFYRVSVATREKEFDAPELPSRQLSVDELIERRKREYNQRNTAENARRLVPVNVRIDGPIAITHFGDPHVDDPGCDIADLERHVRVVNQTKGMFGANLGDLQNNWIGRLARLYSEQSTSARESWALTEWLVRSVQWIYLVSGNHDCWSGANDPLNWIIRDQVGVMDAWGVRIALRFPNDKEVRINARHDFHGHSQWNPAHGPMKAVQMGWRDHILTAGHKHTSFYAGPLKDPASGLLSHAIRCAGFKVHDDYGRQLGLGDQNAAPAAVTIIDPQYDDSDTRLVTVIWDIEEGADYLRFKRDAWETGRRVH